MRKEEWNEALNGIDPGLVEEMLAQKERLQASAKREKQRRRLWWVSALAACLAAAILITGLLLPRGGKHQPDQPDIPDFSNYIVYEAANSSVSMTEGLSHGGKLTKELSEEAKTKLMEFSFAVYAELMASCENKMENQVFSPLSLLFALGMTANGASGETRAQIEAAVGLSVEELNEALYTILTDLESRTDGKIQIADAVWYRNNDGTLAVNPAFLQTCVDYYDAELYHAPFDDTTVKEINGWVEENTDGLIKEMLEEIPSDVMIYLINTLLFEAKWELGFNPDYTRTREFTAYADTVQFVDMMSDDDDFCGYLTGSGFVGFAKKYQNGCSFVALLPEEETDIYEVARELTRETFTELWNARIKSTRVAITMPCFSYECGYEMKDILPRLGITALTDPSAANLSNMAKCQRGNLYVSSVLQRSAIELDENGTKATAATIVVITEETLPKSVKLNRPFIYAIVDDATGLPLFIGTVVNLAG